MKYSFVIPVHNEAGSLPELMAEIEGVRRMLDGPSEVVFVNDGSSDSSGEVLESLRQHHAGVVVVELEKNAGQSAALMVGLENASGQRIITLDADLQNDPNDVSLLIPHLPEFRAVIGRRANRQDSAVKRISSRIANWIRNRLTEEAVSDTGCSLRVIDAELLRKIPRFNGMHRFIPTLCRMEGASIKEVAVSHRHRKHGCTHYGTLNRAFRAFADALAVRWMIKRRLKYKVSGVKR